MVNASIQIVFGGGSITPAGSYSTPEKVEELLKVLQEEGVNVIDTAQAYGGSEELLGQVDAASRFVIDTKHAGPLAPGESTKEKVVRRGEDSLRKLRTDSVDVFYIHAPDRKTPLEGTLAGIDELYRAGKFKRFGLSNFRADEVEEVVRIAKQSHYVQPSVYQGNYSAIARKQETELFPTLRKYNIAFYAYSPIAGGFLTKTKEQLLQGGQGRWDPNTFLGNMYHALYKKPCMLDALDLWDQMSTEFRISKAELAYRWVAYNSHLQGELGDSIIIGSQNADQLRQTVAGLRKGPLSEEVGKRIDVMWKSIEHESPLDNFNDFLSLQPK